MIARIWRGTVRTADADDYAVYIRDTGVSEYAATPGNRGAWILRRDHDGETEFTALSMWDSMDAVRAFAGDDVEQAVYYPEDERYLLRLDATVTHFEVVHAVPGDGGGMPFAP